MRYLLASLIIFLASPAHAEWSEISSGGGVTMYADFETIQRRDGSVFVWKLFDLSRTDLPYRSVAGYVEIDCALRRYRILTSVGYSENMAQGKPTSDKGDLDWDYSPPGTHDAYLIESICQ